MAIHPKILVQLKICAHNYIYYRCGPIMQNGICQPVPLFNFYSLEEFQYLQLIRRSKYFVGLYEHKDTKLQFVVKEVPHSAATLDVLMRLKGMRSENMASVMGVCSFRSQFGWQPNSRVKTQEKEKEDIKERKTLLLFMQKYEMNLHEYVAFRRKHVNIFTVQQIRDFIQQMLTILTQLQRQGIAHRDLKPQNILVHQNKYLLCDFQDAVQVNTNSKALIDLTTVEYSSPQFLRYVRHPKEKVFDPFKLDVYALGLTLLFVCSMGKFSLEERANFIYESSEKSHSDFIKEERVKWVKNQGEYKTFNSLIKMMLEEDEYKRDDFLMLLIKTQAKQEESQNSQLNLSDDNSNSKSSARLKKKQLRKASRQRKRRELQTRQLKAYGVMSAFMIVIFILFCVV